MKSSSRKRVKLTRNAKAGFTVRGLVLQARDGMPQDQFGKLLGVSQASICKYESGENDPPARVIEICMKMVQSQELRGDVSADEIAKRIKTELAGDELAPIRKAFGYVLDRVGRKSSIR